MKKTKIFLYYLFVYLIFDALFSKFYFQKTEYWKEMYKNKFWRISSPYYHHTLKANVDTNAEFWGLKKFRFTTNSLGFRDKTIRKIEKKNINKKRILIIGDSALEGVTSFENTVAGKLIENYNNNYEILNAAVGSYSPTIYYYKIKKLLEDGYKFDSVFVFLDPSDIPDELQYKYDKNFNLILEKNFEKKKLATKVNVFLRDNFLMFRLLNLIRDRTENLKNYIKWKYKASIFFNKTFFSITNEELWVTRGISVDRGLWTNNDPNERYNLNNVAEGISRSEKNLLRLFKMLKKENINFGLLVYPFPSQIYYGDNIHQKHWEEFSEKNNVPFINLYDVFKLKEKNKLDIILENYILGDLHWNDEGNNKVFKFLIKNKIFNTVIGN